MDTGRWFSIHPAMLTAAVLLAMVSTARGSAYLLTPGGAPGSCDDATRAVLEEGGRVRHAFEDGSCIADLGPSEKDRVRRLLGPGWEILSEPVPDSDGPARRVWNRLLAPAAEKAANRRAEGRPLVGDALVPPPQADKGAGSGDYGPLGAGFWDGSEYLLGRVGVKVVLVESDGTAEPSTEDWTDEERALVTAGVGEAMDWWARQAPGGLVSFTYEFTFGVPVPCEPIRQLQRDERLWIRSALDSLGFDGRNPLQGSQGLVNDFKARRGLDWAFVIYVVDSSADEDGMFADGFFAYAYLGGPYMVLTLDNDGWGPENLASVCAHEMGHIFYALDQYYAAHVPCDRRAGYLGQETRNSQYGSCGEDVPLCIMRSCPIDAAVLSETARGQIGWADGDADGIPDILDQAPAVGIARASGGAGIRVEGEAIVTAHPNRNPLGYGHVVTIDTIAAVEYRLDSGPWIGTEVVESLSTAWSVPFSLEASPADSGRHTVEIRARNSVGIWTSPICSTFVVVEAKSRPIPGEEVGPATVRLLGNRPNPFNPVTDVLVVAGAPCAMRAGVYDAQGSFVRTLFEGTIGPGETALRWDGRNERDREVPSGRYFCRVTSARSTSVLPMLLLR